MKIVYFLKDTPVGLSDVQALLTQDSMSATVAALADRLRARL